MKTINKDELYENLNQFLKSKGVELKEGNYTKGVHAGCSLLADAINMSQAGLERARNEIEKQLDYVRQVIHEKTAPKAETAPNQGSGSQTTMPKASPAPKRSKVHKPKPKARRRRAEQAKRK